MSNRRILVVDDDDSLRRVMQMQLEEAGYEVTAACDGQKALGQIEDISPALIITDLKMPGISGLDLLKKLERRIATISLCYNSEIRLGINDIAQGFTHNQVIIN